jgi:hypothetical protein
LDAVGMGIDMVAEKKSKEDDVICIIITDGMENASRKYQFELVALKIAEKKATGKWTFVILGADIDVWEMGNRLNIDANKQMRYQKQRTASTFHAMSEMMNEYVEFKKMNRLEDAYNLNQIKKDIE